MKYFTTHQFRQQLISSSLKELVDYYLCDDVPFVFREQPELYQTLKEHLSKSLGCHESNITVVGSAKVGFSLSPFKFERQFLSRSDIDVIVIDEKLFDLVWNLVLLWHYPQRLTRLNDNDWNGLGVHAKNIYWGWFVPDNVVYNDLTHGNALHQLQTISGLWFNTFQGLGQYRGLMRRRINGRLYRSKEQARMYHMDGFIQLRKLVADARQG